MTTHTSASSPGQTLDSPQQHSDRYGDAKSEHTRTRREEAQPQDDLEMLNTARRVCVARAIPSRVLLRGRPARNVGGTSAVRAPLVCCQVGGQLRHQRSAYSTTASAEEAVPSKKKVWDSVDEAILDVKSGDVVLSGGACRCECEYCRVTKVLLRCRVRIVWDTW